MRRLPRPAARTCGAPVPPRLHRRPSAMNLTSTSELTVVSGFQLLLMSQLMTKRWGGSQTSTLPTSVCEPSSPSSYQRPPRRGSITAIFSGDLPIDALRGHQRPSPDVNTSKAWPWLALTRMLLRTGAMVTVCVIALCPCCDRRRRSRRAFGFGLERRQRLVPELVEPAPQRPKPMRVDVIDAAGALRVVRHQTCLLQDLEMLRHRRAADRHAARDRADRLGSGSQPLEHLPARRIGKRRQGRS